jgi:hypothetical protein
MDMDIKSDRSSWGIGGATLIGLGVGLIFLKTQPCYLLHPFSSGLEQVL